MERLRMVLTPALRSSCSAPFMPKRRMCSGGGGVVSQGKEAGGVVSQGKEAGGDFGSIWQNKIWKTSIVFLGGAAAGYLYNSKATDAGTTKEETMERETEEATERHNKKMERLKRDRDIYDRIHQLQKIESKALWELFWAQMKLLTLEVKVMTLELKVKELAAAARKTNAAADKNE